MSFLWFLSTLLLLDATTCFNDRLFTRESLKRWSHSPENCGINFLPCKRRYFPCFKWLPVTEQRKREAYDHIMATHPTGTPPTPTRNNRPSPRIVGGNDSLSGEFPWSVSIDELIENTQDDWKIQTCNAAFILSDWVLTAGHCVVRDNYELPPHRIRIRYNAEARRYEDLYQVPAARIFVHPNDTKISAAAFYLVDIALIRLAQNVSFEPIHQRNYFRANALCLPDNDWSIGSNNEDVFWGSSFGPTDYSGTRPQMLQKFMEVPKEKLYSRYNLTFLLTDFRIGYANCRFDSGSPLAYHNADGRFFIAGVHVASYHWNRTARCGYDFGYHTQVAHADNLNWVKETISRRMGWS